MREKLTVERRGGADHETHRCAGQWAGEKPDEERPRE